MNRFEELPIRRKLTLIILAICGAVLLLACSAIAVYEIFDFRRALARDATVLADVVGTNVRAALAFDDEKIGREVLHALRSEPQVVAAGVYDDKGAFFVDYRVGNAPPLPLPLPLDGARFADGFLNVTRPIALDGKRVGTITLRLGLEAINDRLLLFGGIATLVLLGSFWVAVALTARLQRPISEPILELAETAKQIAERKDYSVRALTPRGGELGVLTAAFNHMLAGIEQREQALHATNEALRSEVIERKGAEERVREQLARLAQINQITRAIGERQDADSIFQAVVRSLEDEMPVDFCCVCHYDATADELTVARVGDRSAPLAEQLAMPEKGRIKIDANGLSRCVRGELVYEADIAAVPMPFPQRLARGGLGAMVIAPLLVESRVFGVLVAARASANSFSSPDCEFLRQLSEHVALATHQAQLYSALQRAYDDLRQTQQVIMQQERLRALGQMASGIAHDINNAVSPVSLYIESLLEREPGLSDQAREWLQIVQRAIEDVAHTVARMREFYRQREPQLVLAPVFLNRTVEQVADLTRARWFDIPQQRGVVIDLRRELTPNLPPITGVESEIREALINLVFNAVDAMPRGGTLTLRTRLLPSREQGNDGAAAARIGVEVADTGVGMDEEVQRRCLEPFFTTKGDRGTGLGLAMVYGIARRHNAELEIESAINRGTTVRLVFEVAAATSQTSVLIDAPIRPTHRMRLLIVDDDPLLLKSMREILEADGHQVVTASGGQAGINAFADAHRRGEPFAAVITDLGMPYVDGRKVANAVKSTAPETAVFLLTGWGNRLVSEGEMPAQVDRVLGKPPRLRELREVLAMVAVPSHTTPSKS